MPNARIGCRRNRRMRQLAESCRGEDDAASAQSSRMCECRALCSYCVVVFQFAGGRNVLAGLAAKLDSGFEKIWVTRDAQQIGGLLGWGDDGVENADTRGGHNDNNRSDGEKDGDDYVI